MLLELEFQMNLLEFDIQVLLNFNVPLLSKPYLKQTVDPMLSQNGLKLASMIFPHKMSLG